ncbi:alkaline ceramidase family protein [Penicillium hispanicum]|uniref:alkaline ceramidase family protein n=1 Tax=Penicillium hispanicum TaxID=1080232 RepID=UPI002540DCF8|nr:alkaline ceramidase family protein [Penicillium hispanicum]KAJ5584607.1 alkaline ceramidase family protein [Penicillium hispanicum]
MHQAQSIGLNHSDDAFWGPPTAHANFCEEDYVVTRYVAELINSLTNLSYIIYAIYGIYQLRQKPTASPFRAVPYWGLMAVGICSTAFHASLKFHTQMMDDLSMLFATTPVLHRVLTATASRRDSVVMAVVLGSSLTALIVYHLKTDELILHQLSFAGMVLTIAFRTTQLIKTRTEEGSVARSQIWGMVRFGAFIFNTGFYIWILDGWACGLLRRWRGVVGLPWAWLLELHGYWHIFTAIGAYIFIAVVDHLVSGEDHEDLEKSFAWPASWAAQSIFAGKRPVAEETGKKER